MLKDCKTFTFEQDIIDMHNSSPQTEGSESNPYQVNYGFQQTAGHQYKNSKDLRLSTQMSQRNINVKNQLDINPTEVKNPKSKGTLEHEVDFEESRMFDGTISSIYGDDDVSAYYRASITLENSNPQYAK